MYAVIRQYSGASKLIDQLESRKDDVAAGDEQLNRWFGILYAVSGVSAPVEPKSKLRSLAV